MLRPYYAISLTFLIMIVEPIIIAFHTFITLFILLLKIEAIIIIDS